MIVAIVALSSAAAFSFPVHLTPMEVQYAYESDTEWQCFSTSQIRTLECHEWVDDDEKGKEHSDLEFTVEADAEIHEYGFSNANSVCSEFKKDFLDLLRDQKFFCILGSPLGMVDLELRFLRYKPRMSWVFKCLKTRAGQVAWHGGFGFCVND